MSAAPDQPKFVALLPTLGTAVTEDNQVVNINAWIDDDDEPVHHEYATGVCLGPDVNGAYWFLDLDELSVQLVH